MHFPGEYVLHFGFVLEIVVARQRNQGSVLLLINNWICFPFFFLFTTRRKHYYRYSPEQLSKGNRLCFVLERVSEISKPGFFPGLDENWVFQHSLQKASPALAVLHLMDTAVELDSQLLRSCRLESQNRSATWASCTTARSWSHLPSSFPDVWQRLRELGSSSERWAGNRGARLSSCQSPTELPNHGRSSLAFG